MIHLVTALLLHAPAFHGFLACVSAIPLRAHQPDAAIGFHLRRLGKLARLQPVLHRHILGLTPRVPVMPGLRQVLVASPQHIPQLIVRNVAHCEEIG